MERDYQTGSNKTTGFVPRSRELADRGTAIYVLTLWGRILFRATRRLTVCGVALVLSFGCGKDIDTPFVDEPKPATIASTEFCQADARGQYPADSVTIARKGKGENGRHFAEGGGCLSKGFAALLLAAHSKEVLTWTDSSFKGEVKSFHDPRANWAFESNHEAGPPLFRAGWTMHWLYTIKAGDEANPTQVLIEYKKVKGTSHIKYWQGQIEIQRMSDTVTSFTMFNEIDAKRTDEKRAADTVIDWAARLKAAP